MAAGRDARRRAGCTRRRCRAAARERARWSRSRASPRPSTSRCPGSTGSPSASPASSSTPSTTSASRSRRGTHARAGRRIGLRQEHGGAPAGRPVRADARPGRLRRRRRQRRRAAAGVDPAAHADDLPGPVREPQSALEGAGHRRRAAARARLRRRRRRARRREQPHRRARRRAAALGRPRGRRRREVPAPVLGRAAAADLDRARARDRARVPGLRRADLGARRLGAGAGAQHHEGPAGAARPDLSLHLAQPRRRAPRQRRGRRDVPRPDRRARRQGGAVRARRAIRTRACCSTRFPTST